ncbi:hypothetical protein O3P69_012896 [Scylla paramamosain]|uniref:Uncharacterized protein n=1 Tax=Scylla paramamosain TaxID=85552 RepID=A0AAW0TRP5_SCYPA
MAESRLPVGQSRQLANNTIFQRDNDDDMEKLWELMKEKEKLQGEIDSTTMEIDGWLQILHCSTAQELHQLIDNFSTDSTLLPPSFSVVHPSPTRDHLVKYYNTVTRLSAYQMLDCAQACTTAKGELFIKYPWRPPNRPNHECLVLLKPGDDLTYSVVSHNLPPSVPLDRLEREYLQKPQGPEGLRRFIAVVGQYTRPLYVRLQQIMSAEDLVVLQGSVRHNKGATTLSFIVDLKLKEHPSLTAEFVLQFDPLDIFPHTVTAAPLALTGTGADTP